MQTATATNGLRPQPAWRRKGVRGVALDPLAIEQLHELQALVAAQYGIDKLSTSATVRLAIEAGKTAIARAAALKAEGDALETARYGAIKAQAERAKKYRAAPKPVKPGSVVDSLPPASSFGNYQGR